MDKTSIVSGLFHPVVMTVVFIFLSAIVAALVKGRKKDKCLKAFGGFFITLEDVNKKRIWGKLRVESTGLELEYNKKHADTDGHIESSTS